MTDPHAGSETGAAAAASAGTPGVDPAIFVRRYLSHAGTQMAGRSTEALNEIARTALEFGRTRPEGEILLRVADLDADTTAVEIVTRDAPYIVESLVAELVRSNR